MTVVEFDVRAEVAAAGYAVTDGTLWCRYVNEIHDDDDDFIITTAEFPVVLTAGVGTADIHQTPAGNALSVRTQAGTRPKGFRPRAVFVPDSVSPVQFSDLDEVDPATLAPPVPLPGWDAALAAAAASAAAADASADAADVSEAAASGSATAAAGSASAAAGSASAAATSATNASGSAIAAAASAAAAGSLITPTIANGDTTHAPSGDAVFDALALKAPLASPALTGSPTAPTQSAGDNSTKIATTAYADALIAAADAMIFKGVIDASANPNYPAADKGWTYRISVAGKIGGASGDVVQVGDILLCLVDGSAAGTQASVGANWSIAQTNIDGAVIGPASAVDNRVALFDAATGKLIKDSGVLIGAIALLASPTFTGIPAAPTAAPGTNTTQLATTAFVTAADVAGDALKVAKAGDTMTGALTKSYAGTLMDRYINSGASADARRWDIYNNDQLQVIGYTDAGVLQGEALRLYRNGTRAILAGANHFSGTGSPEGVLSAPVGSRYVDTNATNGAVEWVKHSGTGSTGWRVVYGDTGWRALTTTDLHADWRGAGSVVYLRRVGGALHWMVNAVPTVATPPDPGSTQIAALPVGFQATNPSGFTAPDVSGYAETGGAIPTLAVFRVLTNQIQVLLGTRLVDNFTFVRGTGTVHAETTVPWPTTLPGAAA